MILFHTLVCSTLFLLVVHEVTASLPKGRVIDGRKEAINSFDQLKLSDNTQLTNLEIKHTKLKVIKANAFSVLGYLRVLYIRYNTIVTIEANAFNGLGDTLTYLSLEQNHIKSLDPNVFQGLTKLTHLKFERTSVIDETQTNSLKLHFGRMKELNHLYLDSNPDWNLVIDSNTFKRLFNLQNLGLSGNGLTNLGPNVFKDLTNLESLYLQNNNITYLQPNVFRGLTKLEYLKIQMNPITKIDPEAFKDMKRLIKLWYDHDRTENIDFFKKLNLEEVCTIPFADFKQGMVSVACPKTIKTSTVEILSKSETTKSLERSETTTIFQEFETTKGSLERSETTTIFQEFETTKGLQESEEIKTSTVKSLKKSEEIKTSTVKSLKKSKTTKSFKKFEPEKNPRMSKLNKGYQKSNAISWCGGEFSYSFRFLYLATSTLFFLLQ